MRAITVTVGSRISFDEFIHSNYEGECIFLVYRKNREDNRLRLIYIGEKNETVDLDCVASHQHPRYADWLKWAYNDESALQFSIVIAPKQEISLAFDAMVLAFRPAVNSESGEIPTGIGEEVLVNFAGRNICGRPFIRVGMF